MARKNTKKDTVRPARSEDGCDCDVIHEEAVAEVWRAWPDAICQARVSSFFKVMSEHTRLRIVAALTVRELCVCDLAVLLNMKKSAVSHQLRILREANFVRPRRVGKVVYYALKDAHVKEIFDLALVHTLEEQEGSGEPNG